MVEGKTLVTAEELLKLPDTGCRRELVKGEVIEMAPAGRRHGRVANKIAFLLTGHVLAHELGEVLAAETGFILRRDPDTVRAPDVAFTSRERLPEGEVAAGYQEVAPDLAVEVVSPNDAAQEVQAKVEEWLRAGTRLVWMAYPETRSVMVYRSLQDAQVLIEGDTLEGGDVVPGFECRVGEVFT